MRRLLNEELEMVSRMDSIERPEWVHFVDLLIQNLENAIQGIKRVVGSMGLGSPQGVADSLPVRDLRGSVNMVDAVREDASSWKVISEPLPM